MICNKESRTVPYWIRLDNAAKIYPSVLSGRFTGVFRVSVTFSEAIIYSAITETIPHLSQRFPFYNVTMRHGFFWLYLERSGNGPRIFADCNEICAAFPLGHEKEVMYRILVKDKTLSVEFLHVLTDGGGALEFLKTLIWLYLRNCGKLTSLPPGIIDPSELPLPAEYEDSFLRYYDKNADLVKNPSRAIHLPFRLKRNSEFGTTRAEVDAGAVSAAAKRHNVSITSYLTAVYLAVLQDIFFELPPKRRRGTIRVQVPVNLRKIFPSTTLRNFSLFLMPELNLCEEKLSFIEIIDSVDKCLRRETEPGRLGSIIRRNVGGEKKFFIRIMPVFLKKVLLYFFYHIYGAGLNTGVLTNMGRVELPGEIEKHITAFEVTPPPSNKNIKVSCAIVTYGNKMRIVFGSIAEGHKLEREWYSFLAREGIEVKML